MEAKTQDNALTDCARDVDNETTKAIQATLKKNTLFNALLYTLAEVET